MSSLLKRAGLIFDENKVKPYLKMSIQRFQLLINKKNNQVKAGKKDIARLLAEGKEEKARIRVEQVIREDQTAEAYDILELQCELIAGRVRFLASQKDCPLDMEQAVCTLIWAADRAEVSELATVKDQFGKKYGSEFVKKAEINDGGCVNHKVVEKLQCDPPAGYVITQYLVKIAEEYEVEYEPPIPIPPAETKGADAAPRPPEPAREAPLRERPSGVTGAPAAAPSVSAWAVPGEDLPRARPTVEPMPGHAFPDPRGAQGFHPASQSPTMQGHYVHPEPSSPPAHAMDNVGFDASEKGAGPHARGADAKGEGKVDGDDPPPPYTPYDIPSPPKSRPVKPAHTFDIPAAPGYEDPPSKGASSNDAPSAPPEVLSSESPPRRGLNLDEISSRLLTLPGHVGPPGSSEGGDGGDGGNGGDSGEGGGNMDDLAARLLRLRG